MNDATTTAINQVRDNNFNYYLHAYDFAKEWVKTVFKPFSSEDLKEAYYKAGNPPPDEPRVFGAVMRELSTNKLIYHNGYQTYKNPLGHNRPSTVWISHEYRLKQRKNATPDKGQIQLTI